MIDEAITKFFMMAFAMAGVLSVAVHANAQDADLQRAYEACRKHAVYAETRPLRQIGWDAGWEGCEKVDTAWHDAKQANDEAEHRHMIDTVLPKIR